MEIQTNRIELTQGKFALVDEIDKDLADFDWQAIKQGKHIITFYAGRKEFVDKWKQKTIGMHRVILERMLGRKLVKGENTDHINHDGLDNRRANLRVATILENARNKRKSKNCSSQYKGVTWNKQSKKWIAYIQIDKKKKILGFFDCERRAAYVYDYTAILMFGEFCHLNFPISDYLDPEILKLLFGDRFK